MVGKRAAGEPACRPGLDRRSARPGLMGVEPDVTCYDDVGGSQRLLPDDSTTCRNLPGLTRARHKTASDSLGSRLRQSLNLLAPKSAATSA